MNQFIRIDSASASFLCVALSISSKIVYLLFLSFGMSFPKSECKCRAFFVTRNTLLAKIFTHFRLFAVFLIITTVLTMVKHKRDSNYPISSRF